jgi:Mor family transcriptional regulator
VLELIRQIVLAAQLPESLSEHLALEIEKQLRMRYAGDRLYVAKTGSKSDKEERNELIRAQFDGRNHEAIATSRLLKLPADGGSGENAIIYDRVIPGG